jgi:hypothetical protein
VCSGAERGLPCSRTVTGSLLFVCSGGERGLLCSRTAPGQFAIRVFWRRERLALQ